MKGISNEAGKVLEKVLTDCEAAADTCVRLAVDETGRSTLGIDQKREGDHVFDYEARSVLVVGPKTFSLCRDKTLDYADDQFRLW